MIEPLSRELYDILACPVCKGDISYTNDMKGLHCAKCDRVYRIRDGIPILLP